MNKAISKRIGLIVEAQSDFETVKEIIAKISTKTKIVLKKALGKGCGKIRVKCRRMAIDLDNKGCEGLIIIHDLDDNDELELRKRILYSINPNPIGDYAIVIPIKAIEAWLLSDMKAIMNVFNYKKGKIKEIPNTEKIDKPKTYLTNLVNKRMKKRYLNTAHNSKIAKKMDLNKIMKCKSFHPLLDYISEY